jgi:hypothetical protein
MGGQFVANVDDVRPQFRPDANAFLSDSAIYQSTLVRDNGLAASRYAGVPPDGGRPPRTENARKMAR